MLRKPSFENPFRALADHMPQVRGFAFATLLPLPLLALGAVFGGVWAWAALGYIAVLILALDALIARAAPDAPEGVEFPAANRLSVALAVAHFGALALAVFALSGGTGLTWGSWIAVFLGFGMFFGQVSNSNAHELIHRADRGLFVLGMWVYISLLFGHHTSAHRLVHHRFVATPDDPNSAALGEGFWAFAPRAWLGSFIAGYEMEAQRADQRRGGGLRRPLRRVNPYWLYLAGGIGFLVLAGAVFGGGGVLVYLLLCAYAQMQLLLSDYVQHYGLERRALAFDRYEPVGPAHSWDAPHPASSLWMLNAPRHSDHHAHPAREYPALRLGPVTPDRPILPRSLPTMAALALVPPLWRRVMDRRVARLQKARPAPLTP
ncbi:alkane 1-monooxygenase [Phaeovulum sp.]|uniref:alkane 1-monooxygenase n=1 Tax=Phaeovulum sp. TaxID=2934796 RepID=UPI0039E29539